MLAKIFSESLEGIPVHWEVDHTNVLGLTGEVDTLINWLLEHGYVAHVGFGNSRPATRPIAPQNGTHEEGGMAPFDDDEEVIKCGVCGSDVYDNSGDPDRGNRPHYRCKNKECRAGAYISEKTGKLGEFKRLVQTRL